MTHATQILTQEEKTNVDTIKTIMSEKNTTLTSLGNQDWRTVKSKIEKVNDFVTKISTNDIAELNDLIYARAKLVCVKLGIPLNTTGRKSKPGWELRLESQIKKTTSKTTKTEHQESFGRN